MTPDDPPPDDPILDAPLADAAALPTDAELRALLAEARERGDEPAQRLVTSYITLRRLAGEMLTLIEAREGAMTVVRTPIFARLAELARRS